MISPTDPAARYTASANSVAGYAYSDNYLVDLKHAVIVDVEATTTIRQADVGAAKTMLDRTAEQFDLIPSRLVADGGYGSADMVGWLVDERGIEPHVNLIDKSEDTDGTFSRSDFTFDTERDLYVCPGGKELRNPAVLSPCRATPSRRTARSAIAPLNTTATPACSNPSAVQMPARKIARSVHEAARDKARAIAKTQAYAVSCRERKKVEMLFADLKRILRLDRLASRSKTEPKTSSCSPPPPKFSGNWRSSFLIRRRSSPHKAQRPSFVFLTAVLENPGRQDSGFFNKIDVKRPFSEPVRERRSNIPL